MYIYVFIDILYIYILLHYVLCSVPHLHDVTLFLIVRQIVMYSIIYIILHYAILCYVVLHHTIWRYVTLHCRCTMLNWFMNSLLLVEQVHQSPGEGNGLGILGRSRLESRRMAWWVVPVCEVVDLTYGNWGF